jgi:hypothetical protein
MYKLEVLFMMIYLLGGFAVVSTIAIVSLLAGLLRSASASSQITDEQRERSIHHDEQIGGGQQRSLASF